MPDCGGDMPYPQSFSYREIHEIRETREWDGGHRPQAKARHGSRGRWQRHWQSPHANNTVQVGGAKPLTPTLSRGERG